MLRRLERGSRDGFGQLGVSPRSLGLTLSFWQFIGAEAGEATASGALLSCHSMALPGALALELAGWTPGSQTLSAVFLTSRYPAWSLYSAWFLNREATYHVDFLHRLVPWLLV